MTLAWVVGMLVASHSVSDYVISGDVNIGHAAAVAGYINMPNDAKHCWRNAANSNDLCIWVDPNSSMRTPPRTRHKDITAVTAIKGPTAPSSIFLGSFSCLTFDQSKPTETANAHFEIPADWDGSDMTLELRYFPTDGDPFANGEVVEFDVSYRTITAGETYDQGTAAVVSVGHTQSGAGADKVASRGRVTLPAADPNQALTVGSCFTFSVDLDEGATTYSGNPNLCLVHVEYVSDKLSQE